MKISNRVATINGENVTDDGWSVLYKARDMIDAGVQITNLSIGDHDTDTPAFILDEMDRAARAGNTRYAPIPGTDALRQAIADRVTRTTDTPTTLENVFVTTGGQGALFAAMMAATDPGQKVVLIDPHYTTYPATVRAASCQIEIVKADPNNDFQPDAEPLAQACKGASALLINTPNNPTGAVYSPDTLNHIREACVQNDLWLLSDEVYETQSHGPKIISPRALPDMAVRTLALGSLSKSHIMTGFRLGWVVGPKDAITALTHLTNATTYGVAGFIQDAALKALTDGDSTERDTAALYTRRRNRALEALKGSNAVKISPPDGAMYVMLDIRSTGLSGRDFAHKLLEAHKIATMPGESFGQAAAGHIRIALTVDDDTLARALQTIAAYAQTLEDKT